MTRVVTEREMQTETSSLFHGELRGSYNVRNLGERTNVHVQVNDNAEMLIRGAYIPTPRCPITGEVAREYLPMRVAPNGNYAISDFEL